MTKLPHRNELMGPIVEAVKALGGSAANDEIVEKVISVFGIPDDLAAQPYISKRGNTDGRTQLEYDLAWARTYLKQLVSSLTLRGVSGSSPAKTSKTKQFAARRLMLLRCSLIGVNASTHILSRP